MDPATKHLIANRMAVSACVDVHSIELNRYVEPLISLVSLLAFIEKESQRETELPSASPADSPILIGNTMIKKNNE